MTAAGPGRAASTRGAAIAIALAAMLLFGAPAAVSQEDPKPPETIEEGQTCVDCHQALLERRSVHAPLNDGCDACHEQAGSRHSFKLTLPADKLCLDCHELDTGAAAHEPIRKGKCDDCHDPHSSDHPGLMLGTEMDVCGRCHEEVRGERKRHVHGPFAWGMCSACHLPHSSKNEVLLVESGAALCLACHEQLAPAGGSADLNWHKPAQDDCSACHDAHESDVERMLLQEPTSLCYECHQNIKDKLAKAESRHKAVTEGTGCAGCHSPHASPHAHLLTSASADLCLSCHDRTYPQKGGRPMPNLAQELKQRPKHHGPIREKNCEGCHDAHASESFRLLNKPYPPRFYAPFREQDYDLCFACHSKEIVREERSKATNFRDGDRNLHYVHVHRERKGRTCRACHAVHASDNPHHLRDKTPFGKWDLPVGYEKTPQGGTCATGCHSKLGYSRGEG